MAWYQNIYICDASSALMVTFAGLGFFLTYAQC